MVTMIYLLLILGYKNIFETKKGDFFKVQTSNVRLTEAQTDRHMEDGQNI